MNPLATTPQAKATTCDRFNHRQTGNALFFVLIGVVMFAALSFVVARGMRSQSTSAMSEQQAAIAAGDFISYAQKLYLAVQRVIRNGCSENEISFHHVGWAHTNYLHASPPPEKCNIFSTAGGGISFDTLSNAYGKYVQGVGRFSIAGRSAISGIGQTCANASCTELYLVMRMHHAENLCRKINKAANITPELPVSSGLVTANLFNGVYVYSNTLADAAFSGKRAGCYRHASQTHTDGSPYYEFYYVLLER